MSILMKEVAGIRKEVKEIVEGKAPEDKQVIEDHNQSLLEENENIEMDLSDIKKTSIY